MKVSLKKPKVGSCPNKNSSIDLIRASSGLVPVSNGLNQVLAFISLFAKHCNMMKSPMATKRAISRLPLNTAEIYGIGQALLDGRSSGVYEVVQLVQVRLEDNYRAN